MTRPRGVLVVFLALSVLTGLLLTGCDDIDRDQRATRAAKGVGDIVVGVVWGDGLEGKFFEGADLARDQINRQGGILGRKLRLVSVNVRNEAEKDKRRNGLDIAKSLVKNPDLLAVIGHSAGESAISASITYENEGVLFISPAVTDRAFNEHPFNYVFSTIPDEAQIAAQIATFGYGLGYRRIAVLNSREDWADQHTNGFIQHATSMGMTIVARRSFFKQRENFRDILADFGAFQFDALFIVASQDEAALIARQSLEMSLGVPILFADFIDLVALRETLGKETPRIAAPMLFNGYSDRPVVRAFKRDFQDAYGAEPDAWAAQSYDALRMLAKAMEDAKSPAPLSVATILRYTLAWRGVTGRHSFNRGGRIYTKVLSFSTLENGRVEFHNTDGSVVEYKNALP